MVDSIPDKPLVSVVVPTYNQRDSIGRCLESILEQRTDFPVQVAVLDDASTDGTGDIVRAYADRDRRIVPILRKKNLGAVANTKSAIRDISSEYFIITEGDDYWCDAEKLQRQIDALRRHPECSCCGHATEARDKSGKFLYLISRRTKTPEAVFGIARAPWCHTSSMLFRNFLPSLSDSEWRDFEGDGMYLMKALSLGKMMYLDRAMSVYSMNGDGVWTGLTAERKTATTQLNWYKIDQFLKFKYTKMLQPRYLPDNAKTFFTITIPLWKGRKFMVKFQRSKPQKVWR